MASSSLQTRDALYPVERLQGGLVIFALYVLLVIASGCASQAWGSQATDQIKPHHDPVFPTQTMQAFWLFAI